MVDQILQWVGRGATWQLKRRHSTAEQRTKDATTGGAIVYAVLGAFAGFAFFHSAPDISAIDATIFGALSGVCTGIIFGATVETVDSAIKDILKSLDSK